MNLGIQKITERIYYYPCSDETDRPNLGYILGDNYALTIDAGNSAAHVNQFLTSLETLALPYPDYTVITHWHWDHTFGISAINSKIIASSLTNNQLKKVATWEWTNEAMLARLHSGEDIEFCDKHIRIEYPDLNAISIKTADIIFDKTLSLALGGVTANIIHIGGPHSEDSVAIYIPEEKVLFLGDATGGDFYNNDGKYDKTKLLSLIEFLNAVDFDICVEGHDAPISKPTLLSYMAEELEKLE